MNNPRDSFVPLTAQLPAGSGQGGNSITVVAQAPNAQPFRPLEGASSTAPASPPKPKAACEPRVQVKRDGDRVTSIEVHCTCGQVIELGCVYEPPAK